MHKQWIPDPFLQLLERALERGYGQTNSGLNYTSVVVRDKSSQISKGINAT